MNPRDAGAYLNLGKVCRGEGRWPAAEAALRKALELDPQNGGARIELGALYEDQSEFAQAAAEFERAIAIEPNHCGVHCQLGRIYRRQGRLSDAEAALRKALTLDPQDGWVRFELGALCQSRVELGVVCEGQSKFDEAAAEFERAIALDPEHGGAHRHLGQIYRRQGRWPEAEAAFRKALEHDPQDGGARIELGVLYGDQGKFAQAAGEFERVVAKEPNHGGAHCQLGRIYRRQGRPSEAEAALRKALELDPWSGCALSELGALYKDQERFAEAEVAFQNAIAIEPRQGATHLELGNVYRRQGRWREAEAEFKESIAIGPENGRAYAGLWAIYRSQERWPEARAALAKAVAINPSGALACTALPERLDLEKASGGNAARDGSSAGGENRGDRRPSEPAGMNMCLAASLTKDGSGDLTPDQVFCLLPWTHLHIPTDGSFRPCCAWSGPALGDVGSATIEDLWNSPGMRSLRTDMMTGRPVAGCRRCYEEERSGFGSMRQKYGINLSRHRGRQRLTAPDGTLPQLPVPFLDIRLSNICNLRCRICDVKASSAWAADARALGLPIEGGPMQRPYGDWDRLWRQLQPLLENGVEEIRFAGGEPLIMEEHYRILDFLIARGLTDMRLTYHTNFSHLRFQGRDVIDLWSRFRDVKVAASLDGSGRRGEYMRKGLSWCTVVANREEMLRRCPDVSFTILATINIFNALHLPDFHREWVKKRYVERNAFVINLLADPQIYSMQVLPPALKQRVLEAYRRHQESFLDADEMAARDFAAAARFMAAEDRSELLPKFVAMTRRLDALRGEDCREVFPELAALFEAAA